MHSECDPNDVDIPNGTWWADSLRVAGGQRELLPLQTVDCMGRALSANSSVLIRDKTAPRVSRTVLPTLKHHKCTFADFVRCCRAPCHARCHTR